MLHRSRVARLLVALVAALLVLSTMRPADAAVRRTLTVAATPNAAVTGTAVKFSGRLSGSPRGSTVTIQRRVGSTWVLARSTRTTNAAGAYAIRVKVPSFAGTYAFRAFAPSKGRLAVATSRVIRVTALNQTFVALNASPLTVPVGSSTTLSGTVTPYVAGTTVTVQRQNGSTWTNLTTTQVNAYGRYSKRVQVTTTSVYRVSVPRVGLDSAAASPSRLITSGPAIATTSLPHATKGAAYSTALKAVGNPAGTWTASPLPAGLTLHPTTGVIDGTATALGTTHVSVKFTQTSTGLSSATKQLDLVVDAPPAPVIATTSFPQATQNSPYSTTLAAQGSPAGTWTASPLPAGLTLHPDTGVIDGTPTAAGTTQVTIGFTQTSTGLSAAQKTVDLTVVPPPAPVISTTSLPDGKWLTSYSTQLTAVGNPAGTWSATGLPSGLHLNASTGVISGTPLVVGDKSVTIGFTQTGNPTTATPVVLTLHIGG